MVGPTPMCRRLRGLTLVELMVTVAIVSILAILLGPAARQARLGGMGVLQEEQAWILLQYHAARVSRSQPPDPDMVARLAEGLQDATVKRDSKGGLSTLTVTWTPPRGLPQHRSLVVFEGGAAGGSPLLGAGRRGGGWGGSP